MTPLTINQMIADLINKEGGFVDNPHDRGGPTCYGITIPTYAEYFNYPRYNVGAEQIRQVTRALAANIYLKLYYIRPGINFLPEPVRPILLDMAVNNGARTAIHALQQVLLNNNYRVGMLDGVIGSLTVIAATKAVADLGDALINDLVNLRLELYRDIIANDPTQKVFQAGWIARAESFRVKEAA